MIIKGNFVKLNFKKVLSYGLSSEAEFNIDSRDEFKCRINKTKC